MSSETRKYYLIKWGVVHCFPADFHEMLKHFEEVEFKKYDEKKDMEKDARS